MNKEVNKLIPELRFPEFVNHGEWEKKMLGDISTLVNEKVGSRKYALISIDSGVGLISQLEKFGREIAGNSYSSYIVIKKEDFAFNKSSTKIFPEGQISILDKYDSGAVPNSIFTCFRVNNKIIYPYYLKYLFEDNIHGKWLRNYIAVGARANGALNINNSDLFALQIPFPKIIEQQKIADCLSSIDELITFNTNKLETFKTYKKGLMQILFPQEGEKVPKFRFEEFEKDGNWIEKNIKNVFSIFQGFAFSSEDSVSNGVRWLKIADVGIQQMKEENTSFLPINYKEEYERFLVKKGDYVLALTRPILSLELKIAPVDEMFHNALLNQRVGKIVSSNCISFIYYLLHTKKMVLNINKNIAGNEPPNLSFQQIENILINIPIEIAEQKKIAETLSSLDEVIKEQAKKIEQLKLHKRGLMQRLFPKIKNQK